VVAALSAIIPVDADGKAVIGVLTAAARGITRTLHQCAGQHVARLEAEALLTALARRVETIELTGPPRRHHNNTLRAFESLPIRVRIAS
jgi:hypothetical protein